MKAILLALALMPAIASAETVASKKTISMTCLTEMSQFKASSPMFPLIGDTNQKFVFNLVEDQYGEFRATSEVRYMNDQSEDNTNSLHGARASVSYSEGNGFRISVGILKYTDKNSSKSEVVAGVGAYYEATDLEEVGNIMSVHYINPALIHPVATIEEMIFARVLNDYDLALINIQHCYLN